VRLSVVIPCHNEERLLGGQLTALADQDYRGAWEVVVVDDASTDATRAVAASFRSRLPALRIVAAGASGVAHARNAGAAAASGEALLFLDADDRAGAGYLQAMAAALERSDFVAARLETRTLNTGWVARTRLVEQERDLNDVFGFLPWAFGGTLGVVRSVFDAVGGFPTGRRYGDDVGFCWRVQLAGVPLRFVPDAVVHYRYRTDLAGIFRQARRYGRSSAAYYRAFRSSGMPRRPLPWVVLKWLSFVVRLPLVRDRAGWGRWLYDVGIAVGQVQGSIRQRVVYL